MRKVRVAIVGLGGIAQKVYLPILSRARQWELVGAYSPDRQKTTLLCRDYRIRPFASLAELSGECDIAFVHSSTSSHYEVADFLLRHGVHVYVDKPLADTLPQAEALLELARRQRLGLMVGFNRRFAPFYQPARQLMTAAASVRFEKHRLDGIGNSLRFTLFDDYLHLLDTVLWLCDGEMTLLAGQINASTDGELVFASHVFRHRDAMVTIAMHRAAGTRMETLDVVARDTVLRVRDLNRMEQELRGTTRVENAGNWQSVLELRGFAPMVEHVLECVANQTEASIGGEQALIAQRWMENLLA
ncbi:Gfo/Idh/MocA family protein [Paludibacterium yongneupense]|uniref:Gfo/Idh/MocA family protein n=1 Tax=Paludibacterium yongneupense TaxID=400061 RepID=UPI00041E2B68|nr:Gfo/Idh/MocA family oxidoreductase [Paludibacterium yongneupense]